MAVLVDPSSITGETDVEFEFEYPDETKPPEQQAPILSVRQIDNEEVTPRAGTTVIYDMNEEKFWDMLVHTRSRDWTGFCQKNQDGSELGKAHDEL